MTLGSLTTVGGKGVIACAWLPRDTMHMQHQSRPLLRHGEETKTLLPSSLSGEHSIRPADSKCLGIARPCTLSLTKYSRRPSLHSPRVFPQYTARYGEPWGICSSTKLLLPLNFR